MAKKKENKTVSVSNHKGFVLISQPKATFKR